MALDPTIALRINPMRVEQPENALARIIGLHGAMRQNELGALQLGQAKQQMKQDEAWRGALGSVDPSTPEGLSALMRVDPTRAAGVQKTQLDARKAETDYQTSQATLAEKKEAARRRVFEQHLQSLGGVNDPAAAAEWVKSGLSSGLLEMDKAARALQAIPQDPAQFAQWKRREMLAGMSIKEQFEAGKPTLQDFGGFKQSVQIDPITGGAVPVGQQMKKAPEGFTIGANGQMVADPGYLDAKKQIAGAGKASISINTGQKGLDNEFKLRGEFKQEPVYKAHQEMQAAHGQIKQAIAQASPAGDLAAATKIMKLLDPGSVVRESELGMAMQASGLMDRVANYGNMIMTGQKLTPTQRKDFQGLADRLYSESVKAYNAKRGEYQKLGGDYGLDASRALGPEVQQGTGEQPKSPPKVLKFDANGNMVK